MQKYLVGYFLVEPLFYILECIENFELPYPSQTKLLPTFFQTFQSKF